MQCFSVCVYVCSLLHDFRTLTLLVLGTGLRLLNFVIGLQFQ